MHEPVQSALHCVAQLSVVETDTHVVSQWSSQQALQDAWQSVDDDAVTSEASSAEASEEVVVVVVHDALHPAPQREVQSVVQSKVGGLTEHFVVQSVLQLDVQVASAEAVQVVSHCCSSLAAQAVSQFDGTHCVVQSLGVVTSEHCALAVISMSPQAEMPAWAVREDAASAAKATATVT